MCSARGTGSTYKGMAQGSFACRVLASALNPISFGEVSVSTLLPLLGTALHLLSRSCSDLDFRILPTLGIARGEDLVKHLASGLFDCVFCVR